MLSFGVLIWVALYWSDYRRPIGMARWGVIVLAGLIALVPAVSRKINKVLDRIGHPSARTKRIAAIVIALAAAGYFILTAVEQDRDLFPKTHDDNSYFLQMQMLAHGRLWMPPHPLADFFDTFYILVRPVSASQYFPGTALLYVPTVWLHLPTWLMPVVAAGAVVGLVYRILTELIDGAAGAIGAIWIASLSEFRMTSILLMSQVPALLFGLTMILGWLCWRRNQRWLWLPLIGGAAGWAAITRPVDALCFAVPVGAAIVADSIGKPVTKWVQAVALILIAAAPFLTVQIIFDKGVTGHYLKTPFELYQQQDVPGTQFGFPRFDPSVRPHSTLPQKQDYYSNWVMPFIVRHQPGQLARSWIMRWFPMTVVTTLPAPILLPLALVGILGVVGRKRWVLFAVLPLFIILYLFYTIYLEHYAITIMPAACLLCVLGAEKAAAAGGRIGPQLRAAFMMLIVVACITGFWEINHLIVPSSDQVEDEPFHSAALRQINLDIPNAPDLQKPAVILFRYHKGDYFFAEPVFNSGVAWPDDAQIIRAHDLGPQRDREIVKYYAAAPGPPRAFYLFDLKAQNPIAFLGTTAEPDRIERELDRLEPR